MKKNINIAIIPIRIRSKRIKKNIKLFVNKPIIQKTFEIIKKLNFLKKLMLKKLKISF